jgi:hypothetical protein
MAKGCQECEALSREVARLQTLRVTEVKESDVFKTMYAKFSEVIPEIQKVAWKQGAKTMREEIAAHLAHLFDDEVAEFARSVPLSGEEEEDADLQLQMRSRMRRKKGLDA